jgi:Uma2 family endonuclease
VEKSSSCHQPFQIQVTGTLRLLSNWQTGQIKIAQAKRLTLVQALLCPMELATRSPDASWIKLERWNALTEEQKASFAPIYPNFVIELRSSSDTLSGLQDKMQEYIANGASLGWLIDRKKRKVYIYRPNQEPEILENPETVSGDPEIPGFVLRMAKIW